MPGLDSPKWWQVVEGIAADIRSGKLPVGSVAPTPRDLAARFDCDLNTVRRAYDHLRDLGVLDPQTGRGTYVAHTPPDDLQPPARGRLSPLERRLNERIDDLARRLDEHLRSHDRRE